MLSPAKGISLFLRIQRYALREIVRKDRENFTSSSDHFWPFFRVSVQGVKPLGGHFARLCQGFEFYEVEKKLLLFFKIKMEILLHFLSF